MKFLVVLLLLVVCYVNQSDQQFKKLKVSLYYEALCPYCSQFIIQQLYPSYSKIGSSLFLELVPYGNAQRQKVNGTWHFQCQHGPPECALNKVEACGLAKSPDQAKDMEFVNCIESHATYNVDIKQLTDSCAPTLGISGDVLLKCANGAEGSKILARLGAKTEAVDPKIQGVPTICFNNKNNDTIDDEAISDFLGTACKLFPVKPKGCPESNEISYYE